MQWNQILWKIIFSQIAQETNSIQLNSAGLEIHKSTIEVQGIVHASTDVTYNIDKEIVNLSFGEPLPVKENAILTMEFTGDLNDNMRGFYRSKYLTSDGEERFAAVTQFAPIDARRCFPCWVRLNDCLN